MSTADKMFLFGILFQMWGAIEAKGDSTWDVIASITFRITGIVAVIGSFFMGD